MLFPPPPPLLETERWASSFERLVLYYGGTSATGSEGYRLVPYFIHIVNKLLHIESAYETGTVILKLEQQGSVMAPSEKALATKPDGLRTHRVEREN